MREVGSEEARRDFRDLLDDAQRGESARITRHGKAIAILVPAAWYNAAIGYIGLTAEEELPGCWRVLTHSVREARREAGFPGGHEPGNAEEDGR